MNLNNNGKQNNKHNFDEPKNLLRVLQKNVDFLLKERALRLAKKPLSPATTQYIEIVEFRIEEEYYGVEIEFVTKIQSLRDLTLIPGLPPYIIGVINVHSIIVPIIDLRLLFDFEKQSFSKAEFVAIVKTEQAVFGILANEVLDVIRDPN